MFLSENKKSSSDAQGPAGDSLLYAILLCFICGGIYKLLAPVLLAIDHFVHAHTLAIFCTKIILIFFSLALLILALRNRYVRKASQSAITAKDDTSIFIGQEKNEKKPIHIKEAFRSMHTQVIGTTNAGKTSSVILPWAVQDIEQGRGFILIDGKPERELLEKLYAHAIKAGRAQDFMVFSLANTHISSTYNPFAEGSPEQITERFMATLEIENDYYKNIQFAAMRAVVTLLIQRGERPIPGVIRDLLRDKERLAAWSTGLTDRNLASDIQELISLSSDEYKKSLSGIVTSLGHFATGATAKLYNARNPEISLTDVIRHHKIVYFQLPTMLHQFLGEATGKLILQNLQSAISGIQISGMKSKHLFTVYLDDFNDYIYPGFTTLLNKSRSANIGIVFCHQSLGDLEKVGSDFKQIVLTNTNTKIVMNSNDPETAEHFAKIIGTKSAEKVTERRSWSLFRSQNTGEQSVRDVEEYIIHPNTFKSGLRQGDAVVIIPHAAGRVVKEVRMAMAADIQPISMPMRDLPMIDFGEASTSPQMSNGQRLDEAKKKKQEKPTE